MSKKNFKSINPAMQFISALQEQPNALNVQDVLDAQIAQDVIIKNETRSKQAATKKPPQKSEAAIKVVPKKAEVAPLMESKPILPATQGRKGQKLPRINMAFSVSNLEYLQLISRIKGVSMTEYVNQLIMENHKKNKQLIESAKQLLE